MPLASGGFAFKLSCQVMNSKCRCFVSSPADGNMETVFQTRASLGRRLGGNGQRGLSQMLGSPGS